jgi:hypothetical protein
MMLGNLDYSWEDTPFEGIGGNMMEFVACKISRCSKKLMKTLSTRDHDKYSLREGIGITPTYRVD